jgi:hypothetical protein
MLFKQFYAAGRIYLALERIGGVSRGGVGGEGSLARVNNLITGLLDLKIHSMEDNF